MNPDDILNKFGIKTAPGVATATPSDVADSTAPVAKEHTPEISPVGIVNAVGTALDYLYGTFGKAATGFNKAVPPGFSQQVGGAVKELTKSPVAGGIAGFAAGMAEPIGGVTKASKVIPEVGKVGRAIDDVSQATKDWIVTAVNKDHTIKAIPANIIDQATKKVLTPELVKKELAKNPNAFSMLEHDFNPNTLAFEPTKVTAPTVKGLTIDPNNPPFQGFEDITTKILDKLKGKSVTSKQEIKDFTNASDIKQSEKDVIRKILEGESNKIYVNDFANKVKTELLPLERKTLGHAQPNETGGTRYESVNLPDNLRGPVANYSEHIYESPISTSAGAFHFRHTPVGTGENYFAHTRVEDLPPDSYKTGEFSPSPADKGTTRRVIELQSDLFQKGNLEREIPRVSKAPNGKWNVFDNMNDLKGPQFDTEAEARAFAIKDTAKLEPYKNTWQDRIIREEVKQAAIDGKTKLQFPTGETAMKIERLANRDDKWVTLDNKVVDGTNIKDGDLITYQTHEGIPHEDRRFLITKNNGDGTFDAVDSLTAENDHGFYDLLDKKGLLDDGRVPSLEELQPHIESDPTLMNYLSNLSEHLSAQDTIDTNNPIYKFYEKEVGRYLANKYNATKITDPQGVTWWEVNVPKSAAKAPVEAFAALPLAATPTVMNTQNSQSTPQK